MNEWNSINEIQWEEKRKKDLTVLFSSWPCGVSFLGFKYEDWFIFVPVVFSVKSLGVIILRFNPEIEYLGGFILKTGSSCGFGRWADLVWDKFFVLSCFDRNVDVS